VGAEATTINPDPGPVAGAADTYAGMHEQPKSRRTRSNRSFCCISHLGKSDKPIGYEQAFMVVNRVLSLFVRILKILIGQDYHEHRRQFVFLKGSKNRVISYLTTVSGFAALMLSSFGIISNFGLVTVISVFFALIGAIIVMPEIVVGAVRFEKDPDLS
jgi:hypothetical protein